MTSIKLNESQFALATALNEAMQMRHLHAGSDHLFLALLGERYITSGGVLFRFETLEDEAREIVRKQTPKWIFRKHGKDRVATSSDGLLQVLQTAIRLACESSDPNAGPNALHLLAALLIVSEPNFVELLRKLKISVADLQEEVDQALAMRAVN